MKGANMNILLTGKNGQLGFELRRALAPLGNVTAVDFADCDLADSAAIRALIQRVQPNVIVNPAAYTAVDKAETEIALAHAINAVAPGILGQAAAALSALVVHYSTDYVFDGTKQGSYLESDTPNPQSVYGATKLAGEQALQASGARHVIFRTSWVVGAHGGNFAKTMLRLASERTELKIVCDQFGAPTSAALLADISAHIIRQSATCSASEMFPYGLYHLTASGVTHWHEYACYIIEKARSTGLPVTVAPDAIRAVSTRDYPTTARRPANSRLDTQKLCQTFGLNLPDWHEGIDYVLDQLLQQ
jgi:dTDP-4-dehydrorhamnose reductase